jgi:hypothetical protein
MLHKQHGIERQTQCNIKQLWTVFSVNHELTGSDIQREKNSHVVYPLGKPARGGQADDTASPSLLRVRGK